MSYMDPDKCVHYFFSNNHGVMAMMQCIGNRNMSVYVKAELVVEYAFENEDAGYARVRGYSIGGTVNKAESEIDDGFEDDDFSSKDEEHLEAKRHLRWVKLHDIIKSRYDEATSAPPWKNSDTVKS
ncbi:conserved hypothetical protein [Ricinus communis]|uniref:Uncharacterized protein n=1 Tax=Ricinus communis TaxID=3988 RepID=B9SPB3_RICCO|nr:conserved hypothetical protein [Ricinus communis]